MKIGLDAYYLYSQENTGIGNFITSLLVELSGLDRKNTYFLYTPGITNSAVVSKIEQNSNFKIVISDNFLRGSRRLWLQHPSLKKRIKRDNPDLFIGSGEYFPLFLPSKIRKILIVYDVVFKLFPETIPFINKLFYHTIFRLCVREADYFFTISENSRDGIVRFLKPGKREIYIVPCGIDVAKYRTPPGLEKKDYILFVGTIQPRKNLIGLLKAFTMISRDIKESLVVVGASGWKNSSIAEFINGLTDDVKRKIEFKGYISDQDLVKLYQESRLFVAPSLHEGFGLIILEAMAAGTPVVASRVGAVPEFFEGAVVFADPDSPGDIASKMLGVLKDKNIQKSMAEAGIKRSMDFIMEKQAKRCLNIFNIIEKQIFKD